MSQIKRHQIIKQLQAELPRGAPFDLAILARFGVSPQLAAQYAKTGWLVRLAQGVYAFPNDNFDIYGALTLLQKRISGLHIGGKSALALQGIRHNLSSRETWVVWGDDRYVLPAWFTSRFLARYSYARLFDWKNKTLASRTLSTLPGVSTSIRVACPERAVLELLYEVGFKQGLEEARELFDGLRSPRREILGELLSCCTSVKTVRLFLAWSRETELIDVDALLSKYPIRTGSPSRWMTRLDDGTLLTIPPANRSDHG